MGKLLKAEDFTEGGVFQNLILSKELPIQGEVIKYIYGSELGEVNPSMRFTCENDLDQHSMLNLLKKMWELKGIKMYKCPCQSHDHLVSLLDYQEQINPLQSTDFEENGIFNEITLSPELPLPPLIIKHVFGNLSKFDQIIEGKCFKSEITNYNY